MSNFHEETQEEYEAFIKAREEEEEAELEREFRLSSDPCDYDFVEEQREFEELLSLPL